MSKNNVISLENPQGNADGLTSLLRSGARELITKAVQTELAEFLSQYQDMTGSEGRPLVVRNGYLPQREIMTGISPVDIKVPKTRDRGGQCWVNEYEDWRTRDLSKENYVYIWADGIYFNIRSDDAKQCILVIMGVTSGGKKEFLAIEDGYRESEQSWTEVLINAPGARV